jgi:hypothetical protein
MFKLWKFLSCEEGASLETCFFCGGRAKSTRPITRRRFQSWDSRRVIFSFHHGPSHPHKVAWYLKVMATFVSNLLEFVNLLDGCFGGRSWWKLIWLTFSLHVYAMFTPLTSIATGLSTCTLFLFALQQNHLLCYFSNFTPLELGQYPCIVSTSGQPIGVPNMIFICLLHPSHCVLSKFSNPPHVLYIVSKSI